MAGIVGFLSRLRSFGTPTYVSSGLYQHVQTGRPQGFRFMQDKLLEAIRSERDCRVASLLAKTIRGFSTSPLRRPESLTLAVR